MGKILKYIYSYDCQFLAFLCPKHVQESNRKKETLPYLMCMAMLHIHTVTIFDKSKQEFNYL